MPSSIVEFAMSETVRHAASGAISWLLTYAVHSTVLLAFAWLLAHRWADRPDLDELLFKGALVGSLGSASLAWLAPGGWTLAGSSAARAVESAGLGTALLSPAASEGPASEIVGSVGSVAPIGLASLSWELWLAFAWIAAASLGIGCLAFAWVALRYRLRSREALDAETPTARTLAGLLEHSGLGFEVQLSASHRLNVPVAFGILRPEICLPERALRELGRDEMRAVLGHELAHLARRDPAWRLGLRFLAAVLPIQPLLRPAIRRVERQAEVLADDWAVARGETGMALARSLAEIAGWSLEHRSSGLVAAMADGAPLEHRVTRLLDHQADRRVRWRRGTLGGLALALALCGWIAPSWQAAPLEDGEPPPSEVGVEDLEAEEMGEPEIGEFEIGEFEIDEVSLNEVEIDAIEFEDYDSEAEHEEREREIAQRHKEYAERHMERAEVARERAQRDLERAGQARERAARHAERERVVRERVGRREHDERARRLRERVERERAVIHEARERAGEARERAVRVRGEARERAERMRHELEAEMHRLREEIEGRDAELRERTEALYEEAQRLREEAERLRHEEHRMLEELERVRTGETDPNG